MQSVTFNIRHLEEKDLHLEGEIDPEDLDLNTADELIHPADQLKYDLTVEKMEKGALVQGSLRLDVSCECARCLKPFQEQVRLENWTTHLSFEGEEAVPIENDVVDLTPQIREDILLAFPQQPLCEPGCKGLPNPWQDAAKSGKPAGNAADSAWAELNKLKFK